MSRRILNLLGVIVIELLGVILFLSLWNTRIAAETSIRAPRPSETPFRYGVQPWTTHYPTMPASWSDDEHRPSAALIGTEDPNPAHAIVVQ